MEQGWKDLFSELNMHCAGRITLLWGSTSRQHGSGTAGASEFFATRLHYSLVIGVTVQAKSELKTTLLSSTPTPCDEARCPKAFRDFDLERLSAHAREASR
jgi:hypothetical protein